MNRFCNLIFVGAIVFASPLLAAETNEVRVTVDAAKIVRTVDSRLFGINTAFWDGQLDTPETISALGELGARALRFPGGSLSDEYHWESNSLGTNGKPLPTSFANFAHVATSIRAQVFITVNYGSGTPEEAAAWVHHANITHHYGFQYWEIGNENYGDWEHDENTPPHDPVTYATRAKDYFAQMKTVDPTIKIGVVVTATYLERLGVQLQALKKLKFGEALRDAAEGWNTKMLATMKRLGVTPDFVVMHQYPHVLPGMENDAELLQSTGKWSADAAGLRRQLRDTFGEAGARIELLCTENNSIALGTGKQTTSLVNGLYLADNWGQIAQSEFNSYLWWDLRNMQDPKNNNSPKLYGWRQFGDHGMMAGNDMRYPTFYTFKLLKYFARGETRSFTRAATTPNSSGIAWNSTCMRYCEATM